MLVEWLPAFHNSVELCELVFSCWYKLYSNIKLIIEVINYYEKIARKWGMVYTLGKIKKDIYKCIAKEIIAEDIIITDNQIQHILDRHPDVFNQIIESMRNILENPDYIIRDEKHENTGLVIGKNRIWNKTSDSMELVLRVHTSGSEPGYQNSIISCWRISEKRLQNYLRNKRVLYSRE